MAGIIRLNIYLSFDFFKYNPLKLDPTVRKQGLAYSTKPPPPPPPPSTLRVSLPLRSDFSGHKKRRAKQPYCFDLKKKKEGRRRRRNHGFQLSPLIQIQTGFSFLLSIPDHLPPFQSSIIFLTLDSDSS